MKKNSWDKREKAIQETEQLLDRHQNCFLVHIQRLGSLPAVVFVRHKWRHRLSSAAGSYN